MGRRASMWGPAAAIFAVSALFPALASAQATGSNLATARSGSDATSYTTASIALAANALVLAWVINTINSGTAETVSLSGNGLTYVQIDTQLYNGNLNRLSLFRAMGSAPTSGAVTISIDNSQTARSCTLSITRGRGRRWRRYRRDFRSRTGRRGSGAR